MAKKFFITTLLAFCVLLSICVVTSRPARSIACQQVHIFTTGEILTAATLNANPANFATCFSTIDNTNIGPAGIYASQIVPTNSTQATFGGGIGYTFPKGLAVDGAAVPTAGFTCGVANTTACTFKATTGTTTTTGYVFDTSTACHSSGDLDAQFKVNSTTQIGLYCNGQIATGSCAANPAITQAGLLSVCQSSTAGQVNFGTSAEIDYNISTSNVFTANQPLKTAALSNSTTTQSYVPPIYTKAGATAGSTMHGVVDSCNISSSTSCTVTLTNAAVFTSATSYGCGFSLGSSAATGAVTLTNTSGSVITINTTNSVTVTIIVSCFGT